MELSMKTREELLINALKQLLDCEDIWPDSVNDELVIARGNAENLMDLIEGDENGKNE